MDQPAKHGAVGVAGFLINQIIEGKDAGGHSSAGRWNGGVGHRGLLLVWFSDIFNITQEWSRCQY
jgi:hypothetical protein